MEHVYPIGKGLSKVGHDGMLQNVAQYRVQARRGGAAMEKAGATFPAGLPWL